MKADKLDHVVVADADAVVVDAVVAVNVVAAAVAAASAAAAVHVANKKLQDLEKRFGFLDWQHSEH